MLSYVNYIMNNKYNPVESLHKIYGIILETQKRGELRCPLKNICDFQVLCLELEHYLIQIEKNKKDKQTKK